MNAITLEDKYSLQEGRVYLTGVQALVRILLDQRRRDRAAGLNTAGFVSGYRGSPLGAVDLELWQAGKHLDSCDIRFQPALNEELAATALLGTQLLHLDPAPTCDGVFGMWYGKGPGLDRAGDALKHLNAMGMAPLGGVLVVVGDDHAAESSSLAHQSEQAMMSWLMPVLHPASVREYVEFGLLGYAMSRFSGSAVGFKALSETVESAASAPVSPDRPEIILPADIARPPEGLYIRSPEPQIALENRIQNYRLPAAIAFAEANHIDRVTHPVESPRYGIVTVGKAHRDVIQALEDIGLDAAARQRLGLTIYKVGMPWPLAPAPVAAFARGLDEILVVEEKRSLVEAQIRDQFYHLTADCRPRIVGKRDDRGAALLPAHGSLSSGMIARALARRLPPGDHAGRIDDHLRFLDRIEQQAGATPIAIRQPFFCSGCPHNTSTRVPEGSRALAGTGCHLMAAFMDRNTDFLIHMGCEGAAWLGMGPYTKSSHIFQNLGDGTYVHSGILAIRQAVAAKANITYKLLYNDAVAMTGGQPFEGGVTVPRITQQLYHEGVRRLAIVTDEPGKYTGNKDLAPGVTVHHRRELDALQREFREIAGVTALVYDQTCAAEKRRRRKRGLFPDPPKRLFINDLVCEGCGDCTVQSNCLSVEPLETEWGRKRAINQSSCNKDYSCVEGFCPSFVSVHGGHLRKLEASAGGGPGVDIPDPQLPAVAGAYGILVAGVGGTGVVTIGQILGMAAHLEGKGVSVLDFTGLAQKGGGVLSHIRISRNPDSDHPARIAAGRADLLLAGDMVMAIAPEVERAVVAGRTMGVINSKPIPTAAMIADADAPSPVAAERQRIVELLGKGRCDFVDASDAAERLVGNSIASNMFLLGDGWQMGGVPLDRQSIRQAIRLNGVSIEANLAAFEWGRLAAHDRAAFDALTGPLPGDRPALTQSLDDVIDKRAAFLAAYQDAAYGGRYRALVARVRKAEAATAFADGRLSEAVARNFFRLLAYKDEYEVARLYSSGEFAKKIGAAFDGDFRLRVHLAPPLFARRDPVTGHLVKKSYGPWMLRAMKGLARLRRLRGTAFDVFGYSAERRAERSLIERYERDMQELAGKMTERNYTALVALASLPEKIRGYGHVKEAAIGAAVARRAALLADIEEPDARSPMAAE